MGYILKSAYYQADLLSRRTPIERVITDPKTNKEVQRKLRLAQEAKEFAVKHLGLKESHNYRSFVQLTGPYVTYVVSASPKDRLEHHIWWFPIVGGLPYKGYFTEEDAKKEAKSLVEKDYDTYVRGVTAYSTLGWFNDPILSSMMDYDDFDLVDLIIHETVHATIYIKSHADFNERLATFVGTQGASQFYLHHKTSDQKSLQHSQAKNADTKLFSQFISKEIEHLKNYYDQQVTPINEDARSVQFNTIIEHFNLEVLPQLKTDTFRSFASTKLNNARILALQTYVKDLRDFELAFKRLHGDFKQLIAFCRELEKVDDPEKKLANFALVTGDQQANTRD